MSIGLQTLDPDEQKRAGRPYPAEAIDTRGRRHQRHRLRQRELRLDLRARGTAPRELVQELSRRPLGFAPKTITLYPVVFRPLTAIHKRFERNAGDFLEDESKYALYDESVRFLASRGFRQDSFVRFTSAPARRTAPGDRRLRRRAAARPRRRRAQLQRRRALQHRLRGVAKRRHSTSSGASSTSITGPISRSIWLPARRRRAAAAVLRPQSVARAARPSRLRSPLRRRRPRRLRVGARRARRRRLRRGHRRRRVPAHSARVQVQQRDGRAVQVAPCRRARTELRARLMERKRHRSWPP